MAVNQNTLHVTDVVSAGSQSHHSDHGTTPDNRRLYNFGDRVADLSPEESPFFVYLSKVAKAPTDDPVFRFLEDRSKVDWTDRSLLAANSPGTVVAGTTYAFAVDCDNAQAGGDSSGGASCDFLVKGMVLAFNGLTGATNDYSSVVVRIDSAPADQGTSTTFNGKVLSVPGNVSGDNAINANDKAQVIGTQFDEGSGSPDTWSGEIDDDFGYTQIFKTAAEMTNTAIATRYRGYADEWSRIWALKLREHKVDIERSMLYGQRARQGKSQLTDGMVGHIVRTVTPTDGGSNFSYSRGSAYMKTTTTAEFTYDKFLGDLEVVFDPARGGSAEKLCLASLPVITQLNKVGSGGFLDISTASTQVTMPAPLEGRTGAFGHKIMQLETIHGGLAIVKEPLFRGYSSGLMLIVDMGQVAYRPLVGNGVNRDTHIITNVQQADEDLRKDMIITEAGLEITVPESHALYSFESL